MRWKQFFPFIGIILFLYILSTVDFHTISSIFSQISFFYIILSFFCIFPILLITNIEWQYILRKHKIKVTFVNSLKNILIGYFYGFITPGGIGAYTRTYYLQKVSNVSIQQCISNVLLINTIDYFTLLVIGIVGSFYFISISSVFLTIFLIIICLIICFLILYYLFIFHRNLFIDFLQKLFNSRIFGSKNSYSNDVHLFFKDLPSLNDIMFPVILSFSGWILRFYLFFLVSKLFGIELFLIHFIFIIAIGNIVGSIPITIYGLGTREATLISLFSIFQISGDVVVGLSLFWFVVIWIFPSIMGLLIVIKEHLVVIPKKNDV